MSGSRCFIFSARALTIRIISKVPRIDSKTVGGLEFSCSSGLSDVNDDRHIALVNNVVVWNQVHNAAIHKHFIPD